MLVLWHDGVQQRPLKVTLTSEEMMAGFLAEMYITHNAQWPQYLYGTGLKDEYLKNLLKPTEAKYVVTLQNPLTHTLTMVYCSTRNFVKGVYEFCRLTEGFSKIEEGLIITACSNQEMLGTMERNFASKDKVWSRFSSVIMSISGMTVAEAYADLQK